MNRCQGLLDEGGDHIFVFFARQLQRQVGRLARRLGKVFFLDAGEGMIREMLLGRLGRAQDSRHRLGLVRDVHPLLDLQVIEDVLDDLVVEIVAAEMVVAVARYDLDDTCFDPHDRRVEGSAAEIIDQDALALMLRRLIDQGRRCRLIDDANDLQPGNLARLARCLTLRIGEIGRNRDDGLAHRPPEALFGDVLEAFQDDRRDFLWRVLASRRDGLCRCCPSGA